MKALVLSGGSVKGCFQAGAIQAVFEAGFAPDIIYGISVGSLNGTYIANEAGKMVAAGKAKLTTADWVTIADSLQNFWYTNIQKPADVAIQRNTIADVWDIIRNKFNGLSDTTPIYQKVDTIVNLDMVKLSPAKMIVGTVDFLGGEMIYADATNPDYISYVKGSISIPIAMPACISKKNEVLFDGGTRDVAPLGYAINKGARNIIGIICQAENLDPVPEGKTFSQGNLLQLAGRTEDIMVNQNVQNDSQWITFINSVMNEANAKGYKMDALKGYDIVQHTIIQPAKDLTLDITSFTSADIKANWQLGYDTAKQQLQGYAGLV